MIKVRRKAGHGNINHGWLDTYHHFSFASFFDPKKMGYGALRVLNDDYISGNTGFEMHPHKDMEIVTYVIDGTLTHKDSLSNERKVKRGQVQYMSAGDGIFHSEHNNENEMLRLIQMWVLPRTLGGTPKYGDYLFNEEERKDKWLHAVGKGGYIGLNQDVNIYITETDKPFNFDLDKGRKFYMVNLEGETVVNDISLAPGDALFGNEPIHLTPKGTSHVLLVELKGE